MGKEYLIGYFLKRIKRPISLVPTKDYKLVTIKMNHKGVVLRGLKKGGEIKSNMYEVKEGDFILSGIDARNGAFGIVPKELDGAIVTNDFWYFEIDENIISKRLFLELTATTWFDEICKKGSDGTTQRIRLQKDKFFNQKVILPLKEEQEDLLEKLLKFKEKKSELLSEIQTQKESITQLKQSILQEAIQGKLTAEWRAKKTPPLQGEVPKAEGLINNLPHLKTFRKQLRKNLTPAEAKLWTMLKGKQLDGRKFRRQFSVANYILDFYCPQERLAIELDGQGHFEATQAQYDYERDLFLKHTGIKVLRFENKWVWDNPEGILEEIRNNFNPSVPQSGTAPLKGEQLWDARFLLKKIKAEKEKLIKEKKIRKEKPLPPITPEEIPFELPEGWVWCHINELADLYTGNSINKSEKEAKYTKQQKGLVYIGTKDVEFDMKGINYSTGVIIPEKELDKFKIAPKNTVLICIEGGSSGKKIGITTQNICFGNKLLVANTYLNEISNYLFYLYNSPHFKSEFDKQRKGLRGGVSVNSFKNIKIPLPPLAEQKAIVEKVEKLMQKVSAMEEEITKSEQNAGMLMQAVLKEAFEGRKEEVEV